MPGPHVPIREATAYGEGPKYLIRDNEGKFGLGFERVAKTSRIEILKTPYPVPQANAICERFLGSVRRESLDHLFILHEKQLHRVLQAYLRYAQSSPAASRYQAADSGEICWVSATTS
jgi:putative transposase